MKNIITAVFICLLFFAGGIYSQDLDPWSYGNLPIKMNNVSLTYGLITGNVVSDPGAPIQNFETTTNKIVASYLRTFNVFGKLGRAQLIVPFSIMSGSLTYRGKDTSGSRTGFDDPRIRLGVNILGSPPLEPKQFGTYRQEAILGVSLMVFIPVGQYYPERLINLGTNRWGFRPEIGLSFRIGQFYWETYGAVKFTTTNREYLGNKTLSQAPIYGMQTHVCYTFKNRMKVALSGTYVNGGQTTVNDFKSDDYLRHLRGAISLGMNITQAHLIALQYTANITTNISLDYRSLTLTYAYSFF